MSIEKLESELRKVTAERDALKARNAQINNKWACISEMYACGGARVIPDVLHAIDLPPEFFGADESVGKVLEMVRKSRLKEAA